MIDDDPVFPSEAGEVRLEIIDTSRKARPPFSAASIESNVLLTTGDTEVPVLSLRLSTRIEDRRARRLTRDPHRMLFALAKALARLQAQSSPISDKEEHTTDRRTSDGPMEEDGNPP